MTRAYSPYLTTICMCEIICVTNRQLCKEDFLARVEKIAASKPDAIILREKDLPEDQYRTLAQSVISICNKYGVMCILHTYVRVAKELNAPIHLPINIVRDRAHELGGLTYGVSCHSVGDAVEAEHRGASYITAGHIFDTDCKKGLPGRGTEFLQNVTEAVKIPVYAIGGICRENIGEVIKSGAKGACVMSDAMTADNPQSYIKELRQN